MSVLLIAICVAVAVFAATALIVVAIMGEQSAVEARLAEVAPVQPPRNSHGFRDVLTYVTRPLLPFRRLLRSKGEEDLAYRLGLAGYREPRDIDTFLNAKLLCPVLGVLLATFTGRDNMLPFGLVLAAVGFFAPDLYLMRTIARRKRAIALALADAMDLLVMCMEAGLGMDQAMLRVAKDLEFSSPELSDELLIIAREQRMGQPRVDAWRNMADRVDLDTVRQFSSMLTQSERLGTPIASSLGQFADSLRSKRLMEAEEKAAKTTIKMVFPLVLFIFPAMFVVILGPSGLSLIDAFKNLAR
ncbi:MAG TPA: type II secretion system F family protein [Candidatus Eisenbacteria bacterium]|nr:type II secretion system F family protein [Candidatus Eisenbacteria bacterium]